MDIMTWLWTAFFSFLPISELRGGIPFAILNGVPWPAAFAFSVFCNALVSPVCWFFLVYLNRLFLRMEWYRRFFDRFVERARAKLHAQVEKFGWLGIAAFIAIPLPVTGAWTGTVGAWVLGLGKRKTFLAATIGVLVSGIIVTTVVVLGIDALDLFVKHIGAGN